MGYVRRNKYTRKTVKEFDRNKVLAPTYCSLQVNEQQIKQDNTTFTSQHALA